MDFKQKINKKCFPEKKQVSQIFIGTVHGKHDSYKIQSQGYTQKIFVFKKQHG